jgi:uncharacterized protein
MTKTVAAVRVVPRQAWRSVDLVRRWQISLNTGGLDAAWWALDPAIEIRVPGSLPHGGVWHGHDGFRAMITSFRSTWTFARPLSFALRGIGDDTVGVFASGEAHSAQTGKPATISTAEFLTVRDDRIVLVDVYYADTAAVVAALRP